MRERLGIYIHIPFCEKKCNYCGFLSYGKPCINDIDNYVAHLTKEIEINGETIGEKYYVDTVFIGGGTPSMVDSFHIKNIMETIKGNFYLIKDAEITIEVNPNSIDEFKVHSYLSAGINRISMGVQSMNDEILKSIGRIHNRDEVIRAIDIMAKCNVDNYNIDLMFGIPGQTMDMWRETLNEILRYKPPHISFYSLQLEENTVFYTKYKNEELELINKDLNDEMYHFAIDMLKKNGYSHYEISNAALKGYECNHNMKYWTMAEFMGIGLGASSFAMGHRAKNVEDLSKYYALIDEGYASLNADEFKKESKQEAYGIYVFTRLRLTDGIDLSLFEEDFGEKFEDVFSNLMPFIIEQKSLGNVKYDGNIFALTEQGIDVSNEIMCEFV
ncbi:MAG: radical SAM family heme chaperone HemW [Anaerovoracaceae bacterium]